MKRLVIITLLFIVCLASVAILNQSWALTATSESTQNVVVKSENLDDKFDHNGKLRSLPETVTFNAHIRGIMSNTCFACHGPDEEENKSGLRLDSFEGAVDEGGAIEPGEPDESEVYLRLINEDDPMPPTEFLHQLSDYEKALFKKWIKQGANYEKHWAYAPIREFSAPKTSENSQLIRNPIDSFIVARLEQEGLSPSPIADKSTLLRRLSLDLIGLPPTAEELKSFLADESDDAYEKQVDRLLASPHYGERMAAFWLDIVRFSDTVGFHGDQNQRIFPYRDYVIQSLNSNQPFDEFTREQLAGDLLPEPTDDQLTATGLVRLNMMTREGGAQPKEYLAKYTADRVRMIGTAWLGATTGCCECHNHKYDPFSIEDFYSLGAFFDDVRQWGVYTTYGYTPNADLKGFTNDSPFPPELRRQSESLLKQIQYLEMRLEEASSRLVSEEDLNSNTFKEWIKQLTRKSSPDHWQVLRPATVEPKLKEDFEVLKDQSVLFSGPPKPAQQTSLSFAFEQPTVVRSVRMEVLPHDTNQGFIGRGKNGSFRSSLSMSLQSKLSKPATPKEVTPQFVRIELPGPQFLSLAEVQVFSKVDGELVNIAMQGTATQKSTYPNGEASKAIDGNTSGDHSKRASVSHTRDDKDGWWELDLGSEKVLDHVVVWNRTDGGLQGRLKGYRLVLLDKDRQVVFKTAPALPKPSIKVVVPTEFVPNESIVPLPVAFALSDRSNPPRYRSGRPPRYLEGSWRSGPARWQLPVEETKLAHTAVFNLNRPVMLGPDDQFSIEVDSDDVGRIRFSVSPVARSVAGQAAFSSQLSAAVEALQASGETFVSTDHTISKESSIGADSLEVAQRNAIKSAYYQHLTPFDKQAGQVKELGKLIADCRSGLAMTMISQKTEDGKLRTSRILPRGDWQNESGKEVHPNTPAFLPGYQEKPEHRLTRLDLANWLTSSENPMTPRHYVNRVWTQFFGTGLSNKIDDLGNQGEWPSHPQLMDWLAGEFRNGWDRKKIVRLIVTSHTYQQQAAVNKQLQKVDPYNRLLGQQAARRLEAEIIRDNALAISGLLNAQWIGGPSVFPYQPPGYYSNIQFPNRRYVADRDGRQYRRGVYMHWQRTFLHPMLTNFDAPSRDECVASRTQSNSPQQALTLLNDPVFVDISRALTRRVVDESPESSVESWITRGFELAVTRKPNREELDALSKMYKR